jgi:hypothetical protein
MKHWIQFLSVIYLFYFHISHLGTYHGNGKRHIQYDDINTIFNSFFNTYLGIFHCSFPLITINKVIHNNSWIMIGIKTSSK